MNDEKKIPILKFIVFIIDWNKTKIISQVFEEEHVRFHFITRGRGTASSEILDLLGIGASDKAVVLCLEQEVLIPVLLKEVRKKLGFHSPGAGIAFTMPLSGINNPILQVFKESIHKNEKIAAEIENSLAAKKEGGAMSSEIKHDLIISIINQGYSDDFMTVAREAGARGGTVINARGLAHQGPVKFFGVSVQDEREIILILTNREKKAPIMQAISQAYGITSQAGGIVFSVPVDSMMGLSFE
ncbi:nitrogen regulatory protein P-II [Spirochaetia bacterium]|nr:nitrogen regulatory protein P-II [Spirochaetia bacterium]